MHPRSVPHPGIDAVLPRLSDHAVEEIAIPLAVATPRRGLLHVKPNHSLCSRRITLSRESCHGLELGLHALYSLPACDHGVKPPATVSQIATSICWEPLSPPFRAPACEQFTPRGGRVGTYKLNTEKRRAAPPDPRRGPLQRWRRQPGHRRHQIQTRAGARVCHSTTRLVIPVGSSTNKRAPHTRCRSLACMRTGQMRQTVRNPARSAPRRATQPETTRTAKIAWGPGPLPSCPSRVTNLQQQRGVPKKGQVGTVWRPPRSGPREPSSRAS